MRYSIRTTNRSLVIGVLTFALFALAATFRAEAQPAVTITQGPSVAITNANGSVSYTVNIADPVLGVVSLAPASIQLNATGTAAAAGVAVTGAGGSATSTNFAVTLSSLSGDGTLGIMVLANAVTDTASMGSPASTNSTTFIVDTTAPVVTITQGPSVAITNANGSVSYTVNIADPNLGPVTLAPASIQVNATGTAAATGVVVTGAGGSATSTNFAVTLSSLSGDGTLGIMVLANAVTDTAGNGSLASTNSTTFIVDTTAPVVTITQGPSVAITNANGSVSYTVNITDPNLGPVALAPASIQVNATGTAAATGVAVTGAGGSGTSTNFAVTLSSLSGDGTLGITVLANAVTDTAGNGSLASTNSTTFIVDTTAPVVTITQGPSVAITNANGSVSYTVNIADPSLGTVALAPGSIKVNTTGTAAATGVAVTGAGGSAASTNFAVTLSSLSGNGTLGIMVLANAVTDTAGNGSLASTNSTAFIVDTTAPVVTITQGPSVAITNANGSVSYTVNIADPSLGTVALAPGSIKVNTTGTAAATGVAVTGAGGSAASTNFAVTLSSLSGNGTLGIMVLANAVTDTAGNGSLASTNSTAFIVDTTAPVVTITQGPSVAITNANGSVSYTVNIADPSLGTVTLAPGNIKVNTTGTAAATGVAVTGAGGSATSTNFAVTLSSLSGNGTLGIMVLANAVTDTAGNGSLASTNSTAFIVDTTAPVVTITQGPSVAITNANGFVSYTVNIADPSLGTVALAPGSIKVNTTGTAAATGVAVTGAGGSAASTNFAVTLSSLSGNGTLGIMVLANAVTDTAGNGNLVSTNSTTFIVDTTAPVVTITQGPSVAITNANGSVSYTVNIADPSLGTVTLAPGNIKVNTTGTAAAGVAVTGAGGSGTSTNFAVTLSSLSGNGTLGIMVLANAVTDTAGNGSLGSTNSTTFIVDTNAPTIQISAPSHLYTSSNVVSYTVSYSDPHLLTTTLTSANVTVNQLSGTAQGTAVVLGSGPAYTVAVTNTTGNGQLSITIGAGTSLDTAGNANLATNSTAFTVDNINPAVTVGLPSVSLANASGQVGFQVDYYDLNFSTAALKSNDVVVSATGTAAAGSVTVTGASSGGPSTNFLVTLSGLTGDGTLTIAVNPGVASDLAGNFDAGAASPTNFILYTNPPAVTISGPSTNFGNSGSQVTYTVTVNDPYLIAPTLASNDIVQVAVGSARATSVTVASGAGSTATNVNFTVTLGGLVGQGTLGFRLTNGFALDLAGNANIQSTNSTPFAVSAIAPQIVISGPSPGKTTNGPVTYTVSYRSTNSFVSTLSLANITLNQAGSANGTLVLAGASNAYTLVMTNISGTGALGISIAAGTAYDTNGNYAPAAGPSGTVVVLSGIGAAGQGAATLDILPPSGNSVIVTLHGIASATYVVQANTNLASTNWLSAGTTTLDGSGNGTLTILGGINSNPAVPAQFYRAILP